MPTLYMSKRSGLFMRHRMGDSSAATGRGGALQNTGKVGWRRVQYCYQLLPAGQSDPAFLRLHQPSLLST